VSSSPGEIRRWMQHLVARSIEEQVRGAQRYGELIRRVARGDLDEQSVRSRYAEFMREETGRYVRNVVSLGLAYYDNLLEAGWDYGNRFFDRLLGEESGERSQGVVRRVAMDLRAPIGKDAVGSFVMQNKRTDPVDISFIVSEFSGPDDGRLFRPPLRITPPRFSMPPRSEQAVEIRVPVLSGLFEPGKPHTATVAVRGQEALELVLTVWAEDGGTAARRARGAAARKTPRGGAGKRTTPPIKKGETRPAAKSTGTRGMGAGTRSTRAGAGRAGAVKKTAASRGVAKKSATSRGVAKRSMASRAAPKKATGRRTTGRG
jgi:hypothetical protein